jgi:hypothetical protein
MAELTEIKEKALLQDQEERHELNPFLFSLKNVQFHTIKYERVREREKERERKKERKREREKERERVFLTAFSVLVVRKCRQNPVSEHLLNLVRSTP